MDAVRNQNLNVRLFPAEKALIERYAAASKTSSSALVREWLAAYEKRAKSRRPVVEEPPTENR